MNMLHLYYPNVDYCFSTDFLTFFKKKNVQLFKNSAQKKFKKSDYLVIFQFYK